MRLRLDGRASVRQPHPSVDLLEGADLGDEDELVLRGTDERRFLVYIEGCDLGLDLLGASLQKGSRSASLTPRYARALVSSRRKPSRGVVRPGSLRRLEELARGRSQRPEILLVLARPLVYECVQLEVNLVEPACEVDREDVAVAPALEPVDEAGGATRSPRATAERR